MCESQSEGGKRCAAHTRPVYEAALTTMGDRATNPDLYNQMYRDRWEATTEATEIFDAVAEHASTPQGDKEVAAKIEELRRIDGKINKFALMMIRARRRGEELAEERKEIKAAIKKERERILRSANRSSGELTRSTKATEDWNLQAVFPGVAAMWDTEKNNGILPTEVTPNVNKDIWLVCQQGHTFSGRGNNIVAPIRNGKRFYPLCPECEGRKPRQFAVAKEELASLTDALSGDPDAFNALSPALQYSLLSKMGFLRGGEDSMNRSIGMSIVHGDLTLKDVVTANELSDIDGRVRDNLDDEEALATLADLEINDTDTTTNTGPRTTEDQIDQVLASTGVLSLIDEDSELALNIARENNEALWAQAYKVDDLDNFVAFLNNKRGKTEARDATINRFLTELEATRNLPLPDGYATHRLDKYGNPVVMDPTLAQRRFAAMVEDRRRVMNWSGTGAGKTLSASLAVQTTGARETLVVCPNAVIEEWTTEFKNGFPDNVEIREGLPKPGETLPDLPDGVNRVWVVNYEKFQSGDDPNLAAKINPLADRVDAIVFDEIHNAKVRDAASASQRRGALERFTDRAGRANPDLVVIGASATPVVNNLEEAASVLRLVEGPDSKKFPTAPTIKNAAAAHHRLAAAGVRHMPDYPTELKRDNVTVDITDNIHKVQARIDVLKRNSNSKSTGVTEAMMERALLPEKIPTLINQVQANKDKGQGPTIVYTDYTTGMVNPMRDALTNAGLRVGTYIGNESATDRAQTLRDFRDGKYDALIGSRPIATGVDGLQHTANNMIVVSMSNTAAADDQLVGRLQRRGQQRDVNVSYILTEAKVGEARWSWCKDHRQKRIHFKRGIANAAVDGVLPDGALESREKGAEKALDALKSLTEALTRSNTTTAA